ncbi:porin family protein [Bacteroidota bacterium]
MKHLFYSFIILTIILATNISAQVSLGLFGGVNYADLKSDLDVIESTSMLGIGGLIEYNLSDELSLVAQPSYLQKGGMQPESDTQPELIITTAYFELPLLLKYKFNYFGAIKPYLIAGPSAGYRLSADMEATIGMVTVNADLKEISKDFDFGITMGAGIEIPLESIFIFVEGRYSLGLIDLHKNGTVYAEGGGTTFPVTFDDESWYKTKGIQIMGGIKFPIGK